MQLPSGCDIFCTVIDNYGDIGVCWRLARQLAAEYPLAVRLWVDDLAALQRIWPTISSTAAIQHIAGVEVHWWRTPFDAVEPAAIAIEAFACELPPLYVEAMTRRLRKPVWINLEYLSAEDWVSACHGLPSPQPQTGLDKYFFFPGFSAATGGLLRERELLTQRDAFQANPASRAAFLAQFQLRVTPDALVVSLFAYANAALPALLTAWAESPRPIVCLMPEGQSLPAVAEYFGMPELAAGATCIRGALALTVLPFLPQDDFDRLLWSCDINFVRGEDSFARAQWAGRPLIWHIYPQAEDAHWPKLAAFLAIYLRTTAGSEPTFAPPAALLDCWHAWNGAGDIATAWRALQPAVEALSQPARNWSRQLARDGNLAAALVQFCANHV